MPLNPQFVTVASIIRLYGRPVGGGAYEVKLDNATMLSFSPFAQIERSARPGWRHPALSPQHYRRGGRAR